MEKKIRYTLGKKERVKSRKVIEQLFEKGHSFSVFPFRVLYLLNPIQSFSDEDIGKITGAALQAGFSVSSRHFKRAVDRNRIKRLMREGWRLQKNELQLLTEKKSLLQLFVIYTGKDLPEYRSVYEKMTLVIKRLIKLTGESN